MTGLVQANERCKPSGSISIFETEYATYECNVTDLKIPFYGPNQDEILHNLCKGFFPNEEEIRFIKRYNGLFGYHSSVGIDQSKTNNVVIQHPQPKTYPQSIDKYYEKLEKVTCGKPNICQLFNDEWTFFKDICEQNPESHNQSAEFRNMCLSTKTKSLFRDWLNKNNTPFVMDEKGELDILTHPILVESHANDHCIEITSLSLNSIDLTVLPSSIRGMKALQKIHLLSGKLATLPEEITTLSSLQYLTITGHKLVSIPENIGKLTSLKFLQLFRNKIASVPPSLTDLNQLEYLNLGDNRELQKLPDDIGRLKNLKGLYVWGGMSLLELPESVGNLENLEDLVLGNNKLLIVPLSIGKLRKLKRLNLENNQLTELPESIGNLSNLTQLEISENLMMELPDQIGNLSSLKKLALSNNQLFQLPDSISQLKNLTKLDIGSNRFESFDDLSELEALTCLDLDFNPATPTAKIFENLRNLKNLTSLNLGRITVIGKLKTQEINNRYGMRLRHFNDSSCN